VKIRQRFAPAFAPVWNGAAYTSMQIGTRLRFTCHQEVQPGSVKMQQR